MNTVEKLLKLDINDLIPTKKTHKIEIERISNKLSKKGIDDGFFITIETVSPEVIFDYESAIYDYTEKGMKINKEEMYKQGLNVCCCSIIDPKYNDPQLIDFLGIKMKEPTADVVWKKLLIKQEIVNVANIIIEQSRKNLDEEQYNAELKRIRDKSKKV